MKRTRGRKHGSRFLILGASGMLGSRILEFLQGEYDVVGTYLTRPIPECTQCDLQNLADVRRIVDSAKPEFIVHAAGMTRPDECEANIDAAHRVNVDGVRFLAGVGGTAKILFFSTDYVFDGTRSEYNEDDAPHPINHYGRTKLEAERVLLQLRPDSVVVRVAGLFGISRWNTEFVDSLASNPQLRVSADHVSSYTFIDDICRSLPILCTSRGVLHLVGPDSFSRADFAQLACSQLGLDVQVIPVPGPVAYPRAPRPLNSSLVSSRLSLQMSPTQQALKQIRLSIKNAAYEERHS